MQTRAAILSSLIIGSSIVLAALILRPVRADVTPPAPAEKPCPRLPVGGPSSTFEEDQALRERIQRERERIRRERPECVH